MDRDRAGVDQCPLLRIEQPAEHRHEHPLRQRVVEVRIQVPQEIIGRDEPGRQLIQKTAQRGADQRRLRPFPETSARQSSRQPSIRRKS